MKINSCLLIFLLSFTTAKAQSYSTKQIEDLIDSSYDEKDYNKALKISENAYRLSEKINYKEGKKYALHATLEFYISLREDKKVIQYSNKLWSIAKDDDDHYYQSVALKYKIYAYSYLGFYNEAEENADEAELIVRDLKGDEFYAIMGDIYQAKSEIENLRAGSQLKVLDYNRKSLKFYEKIQDEKTRNFSLPMQYYNLSFSFVENGEKRFRYILQ